MKTRRGNYNLNLYTCLWLFLSASVDATHFWDDDVLKFDDDDRSSILLTNSPTDVPSSFPSQKPSSMPTKSPTKLPTISTESPSHGPSFTPSISTQSPTSEPTFVATKQPIVDRNQIITESPTEIKVEPCELNGDVFGVETNEKMTIKYFYKMIYKENADVNEPIMDLDTAISNVVVNDAGFFSSCQSYNEADVSFDSKVVGITSLPMDQFSSFCGASCSIVEGRLGLFISSSEERRLEVNDYENNALAAIEKSMDGDELLQVNENIVELVYLDPNDPEILGGSTESEDEPIGQTADKPVGGGLPTYMTALMVSSATIVIAAMVYAFQRKGTKGEEDDDAVVENSYDDSSREGPKGDSLDLQDDCSTSFFDLSLLQYKQRATADSSVDSYGYEH
ncbi:hypothetical protein CTEN210_09715 [Chaetoceros tenuissimus]|uniref:Transmembrane protein n=1 Tax=Chaetoceros tenuissimus TaxID=426638 RepID=A0AAD3H7X6_9STRA|nr:hypothetical protein CTEN210_09715 [Chaetoceros tenuissimus]